MKKSISLLCSSLLLASGVSAQSSEDFSSYRNRIKGEFKQYKKTKESDFLLYRKQRNEEFANYLSAKWKDFKTFAKEKRPTRPEPVNPVIYKKDPMDGEKQPVKLPAPDVQPPSKPESPVPDPQFPDAPSSETPETVYAISFPFYGVQCTLSTPSSYKLPLTDHNLSEAEVAKCWRMLSDEKYNTHISNCLYMKRKFDLCDWAYLKMLQKAGQQLFRESNNMQVLYTAYVMVQSGYDVKLAKSGANLHLLVHPDCQLYQLPYLLEGDKKYYIITTSQSSISLQTYPLNFSDQLRPLAMRVTRYPKFGKEKETNNISYVSDRWKIAAPFQVAVNPGIIQFFKDYPQCEWTVYAQSGMSPEFVTQVLPQFRKITEGLKQQEAVALLLDYVQHGFAYKTDHDQFGYEKPFFVDENFYYPYNDCEDRAILFSTLVRELLHLETVFLHYPEHLATAVCFTENVAGDFVQVGNKKYVVCDPTYIGAPIGKSMPQFQNVQAKVIK